MKTEPILATGVTCKVLLPESLRFANKQKIATSEVGNATANSDLTFSFSAQSSIATQSIPIQTQLRYSRPDGALILRVCTRMAPVTEERPQSEMNIDVALVGMNAVHRAAALAQDGDFTVPLFLSLFLLALTL